MNRLLMRCVNFQQSENANARNSYMGKLGSVSVERAALECYGSLGRTGLWAENQYWWHIMALLFWQVIFARITGVYSPRLGKFPNALQDMPNDFFMRDFYAKRLTMIERRMQELRNCASVSRVLSTAYSAYKGVACRPIEDWNRYSLHDLSVGAESLTREQLLLIMNRLLADFNTYRSGLPDLFFYEPNPLFVEVKSESDSIRDNQLHWLQFLSGNVGVAVEVLLVNHHQDKAESMRKTLETRGFNVWLVRNSTQ